MIVRYRSANGHLEFQFDAPTQKDVWAKLAAIQQCFEIKCCGRCQSQKLEFKHITTGEGYEYLKMHCVECTAQLNMGQHKEGGGLWPKTRDTDGNEMECGGWSVWEPEHKRTQEQPGMPTDTPKEHVAETGTVPVVASEIPF